MQNPKHLSEKKKRSHQRSSFSKRLLFTRRCLLHPISIQVIFHLQLQAPRDWIDHEEIRDLMLAVPGDDSSEIPGKPILEWWGLTFFLFLWGREFFFDWRIWGRSEGPIAPKTIWVKQLNPKQDYVDKRKNNQNLLCKFAVRGLSLTFTCLC